MRHSLLAAALAASTACASSLPPAATGSVPGGAVAATAAAAPEVVPDTAAARHIGRTVTVEGIVARVKPSQHRATTYLNFGADHPNHAFAVLVPDSALARVGGAGRLAALQGKRVRATGTVWLQDGKWPAMTVVDSAQLAVVGGAR